MHHLPQWSVGWLSHQSDHGSSPRWEFLYDPFDGELVLTCLHAINVIQHQLASQTTVEYGAY